MRIHQKFSFLAVGFALSVFSSCGGGDEKPPLNSYIPPGGTPSEGIAQTETLTAESCEGQFKETSAYPIENFLSLTEDEKILALSIYWNQNALQNLIENAFAYSPENTFTDQSLKALALKELAACGLEGTKSEFSEPLDEYWFSRSAPLTDPGNECPVTFSSSVVRDQYVSTSERIEEKGKFNLLLYFKQNQDASPLLRYLQLKTVKTHNGRVSRTTDFSEEGIGRRNINYSYVSTVLFQDHIFVSESAVDRKACWNDKISKEKSASIVKSRRKVHFPKNSSLSSEKRLLIETTQVREISGAGSEETRLNNEIVSEEEIDRLYDLAQKKGLVVRKF
jgi:hypothetical protein